LSGLSDFLPNWQLVGGTVTLAPNFQTNGSIVHLDLNGATLAGSNQVSGVLNFNNGTIAGPLIVSSNAVLNWNAGRFGQGSSLLINSNGLVNLASSGEKDLGGPLTNFGTMAWTGGSFYLLNDASTWLGLIQNFGLWDTRADLQLSRWFGNDFSTVQNIAGLR